MMEKLKNLNLWTGKKYYIKFKKQIILKTNCNLVFANFLIRHGLLTNKNEKKYEEILRYN